MRITKKQSIADRLAKSFIKGGGEISLKSLMSDEKDDLEELLKTLSEQQNLSEEQKEQLNKIIKTAKKNTRGLKELADLQQEAFFDARDQGKGVFASLKAADKLKEDYEAATTGVRSRFGGLVTALGGPEELAQAVDLAFGKKVSKEEREELKKKFAAEKVKSKKKGKKEKITAANEKQTATKKPRGRIDPVTGQFIRTDLESKVVGKSEDPVLKAISETPKAVDALINEESLDKKIDKILESVGEKNLPLNVHDKLNIIMQAVGIDLLSDLTDLISGGGGGVGRRGRRGRRDRTARRVRGGGGGRLGVGGLLAGAAVGGLSYMAVDSFRDEDLVSEDPELLKQDAIAAREAGDVEAKQEIQEQITAQKKDVKIQAAATGAGIAGAVGGAVAATKIANSAAAIKAKNKMWDLFMNFLKKRAPGLAAKVGVRLAAAGGLALIPFAGWVAAAVTVVGSIWLAYDLYKLWREFSNLSDAEKELYSDDIEKKADKEVAAETSQTRDVLESNTSLPTAPGVIPAPTTPTTSSELPPIRVSSSMPGAMPAATETAPSADELKKYVRLKDNSINLDGLNEQMKERLAGLAKEYFSKTGQKIQINSGYRSPEEQAALFAKYGAPRAAPPGRSRHESGLAIDINSTDANKAIELGLMAKYGFVRPVRGETWHIEPIETAKRGVVPDNPFAPGKPIVAANDGKEINPATGTNPTSVAAQPAKQAEMGAAVASATPTTAPPQTSGAAMASAAPAAITATPVATTPISGDVVARQTTEVTAAKEQMMVSASPAVVPVPVGGQSQSAKPTPPNNSQPASTRDSESSFSRALAKDFAHPSAFTTIGTV